MWPQPDNPSADAAEIEPDLPGEYSPDERALLLRLAHDSIAAALDGRAVPVDPPSPHLAQKRGAFTTVYIEGQLRGCVGYVFPVMSVYQAVAETARAAAFQDSRFPPVSREEAGELQVSLSILSVLLPISADEVEIGRHGLLVTCAGQRGLLLPQVAVEHHWDRITFLGQTCRKAGLPIDAWQKDASLEAFTAEVFGDKGAEP